MCYFNDNKVFFYFIKKKITDFSFVKFANTINGCTLCGRKKHNINSNISLRDCFSNSQTRGMRSTGKNCEKKYVYFPKLQ